MANEANVDIEKIKGTGKNGIILKEDIMSLMGSKPSPSERKIKYGPEERVRMTRLRLTIAKRLKEAQENAAMLTTFNEVDMKEVMEMRGQYKEDFQKYVVTDFIDKYYNGQTPNPCIMCNEYMKFDFLLKKSLQHLFQIFQEFLPSHLIKFDQQTLLSLCKQLVWKVE